MKAVFATTVLALFVYACAGFLGAAATLKAADSLTTRMAAAEQQ